MMTQRRKGILLAVAGAFWGAAYLIPYGAAVARVGARGMVLPMLLSAAVINTIMIGFTHVRKPLRLNRTSLGVAVLLGVFSALGNEAMAHALVSIGPGIASVILRSQVIFVAVLGWWLLKERVSLRFWLGMLLALGGVALLQGRPGETPGIAAAGLAWALVAAMAFAAMQVLIRKTIQRIDLVMVNGLRLWFATLFIACFPGRIEHLAGADLQVWLLAGATALFGPVISRIFLMLALRHIPVALSTLVLFIAPVFAFVLGGLFFLEWPDLLELVGCLIILAGIALPVLEKAKKRRDPRT